MLRIHDCGAAPGKGREMSLRGWMTEHTLFHRRGKDNWRGSRERDQTQHVVGETERESGNRRGRRWRYEQEFCVLCNADVAREVGMPRSERVGVHGSLGDRRERERLNEALGGLCHHDVNDRPGPDEEAGDHSRLVRGNAACHCEEDGLAAEFSHSALSSAMPVPYLPRDSIAEQDLAARPVESVRGLTIDGGLIAGTVTWAWRTSKQRRSGRWR